MFNFKKLISMFLILTITLSLNIFVNASNTNDDDIYRKEKFIKIGKDDYTLSEESNLIIKNKGLDKILQKNDKLKDKVIKELKNGKKLAAYKSVEVYVKETISIVNGKKEITESSLMTNLEVNQFLKDRRNEQNLENTLITDTQDILTLSSSYDTETKGKLTIHIARFDDGLGKYTIVGEAEWDGLSYSGSYGPDVGEDFIAITWGGGDELKATSYDIYGWYNMTEDNVRYYRVKSDYQKGYIWSFDEINYITSGYNEYAYYNRAEVNLEKTYSSTKNKYTSARLTYVHTYTSAEISVGFSVSPGPSIAPSISISGSSKQWPLEVEITDLLY